MIEQFIILIVIAMMARKVSRSHTKARRIIAGYVRGNLNIDMALGTLASDTGILSPTDTVIDRMLISSIVATYSLSNLTTTQNTGPLEMGVAHSDYTLAEIEEWIELATSWNESDLLDKEVQSRKIRRIGVFQSPEGAAGGFSALNLGQALKTKLNWVVTNGQGLNFWVYNRGTAALATTDPNVNISGHANLWPR